MGQAELRMMNQFHPLARFGDIEVVRRDSHLQAQIEGALPAELCASARGQSCTLAEIVNALLGAVEAG